MLRKPIIWLDLLRYLVYVLIMQLLIVRADCILGVICIIIYNLLIFIIIIKRSFNCLCHYNELDLFDLWSYISISNSRQICNRCDIGCEDRYTIILSCLPSVKNENKEIIKFWKQNETELKKKALNMIYF